MLSIHEISKSHARHYFSNGNVREPEWLGDDVERLGFDAFRFKDFREVVENPLAGFKKIGYEFVASAPKSASIEAFVKGNDDVLVAHHRAMLATATAVEEQIRCQVRKNRVRTSEVSGSGVMALFTHGTSREDEPQLHGHLVLLNGTFHKGKFRSPHVYALYKQAGALGQLFRDEFRKELTKFGLNTVSTKGSKGKFEIEGYSRERIMEFSTRRKQILALVGEGASVEQRQWASLATRKEKNHAEMDVLLEWWKERDKPFDDLGKEEIVLTGMLSEKHWDEVVKGSGVDPELARLNFESIGGDLVVERLLQYDIPTGGWADQFRVDKVKRKMDFVENSSLYDGGLWGRGGIDAQDLKADSSWGSFKADSPRVADDGDPIKYEHPFGKGTRRIFLMHVPPTLAAQVWEKHGIKPLPGETFWETVKRTQVPITITEGAKKTASLLSEGVVTIGVPGVNGVYRKDENGKRFLHPDVAVFANGRDFTFAFDQDSKVSTRHKVRDAMIKGATLLAMAGSSVNVKKWSWKLGKGVDDLKVAHGFKAYEDAPVNDWREDAARDYRMRYKNLNRWLPKNAEPGLRDVGILFKGIARYDFDTAIKIVAQSDAIRDLPYQQKVKAVASSVKTLEKRLSADIEI